MKFIADEMLGKLAKWMRLLGYDTEYVKLKDDNYLVNKAFQEQRILLTRDTRIIERKFIPRFLLVKSDDFTKQLREVIKNFNLVPAEELFFTRCLICNTNIKPISKDLARDKVPAYVYETQEDFLICTICNRIYWRGTHVEKAKERLKEILYEEP